MAEFVAMVYVEIKKYKKCAIDQYSAYIIDEVNFVRYICNDCMFKK